MAQTERVICPSSALVDGGPGVRFTMQRDGRDAAAFVIRYDGKVHAYLNSCAHIPVELDWMEGEFFDKAGLYLVCATHGATYEPATGHCIMGPCKGQRLIAVPVDERDGEIFLKESANRNG
ncbi:MAG TPA: Rieske 2Fe-2S domain-containing protein [Burkholderiales bacterium]|nr:Rieske 2Fe-2S domain-containing protein [Burkholderiales bacterium]